MGSDKRLTVSDEWLTVNSIYSIPHSVYSVILSITQKYYFRPYHSLLSQKGKVRYSSGKPGIDCFVW